MKYNWRTRLSWQKGKYVVKVNQLKLELGMFGAKVAAAANGNNMAIQVTGQATKKGKASSSTWRNLLPFHRTTKLGYTHTTSSKTFLTSKAPTIIWDARDLCCFQLVLKDGSIIEACHMEFHVLHEQGDAGEYRPKMAMVGKVSVSVTMAEITESNCRRVQRALPIQLKVHGLNIGATLSVSLNLLDLRNFHDYLPRYSENLVESKNKHGVIEMVKFDHTRQPSPYELDDSTEFDSDDSSIESTTSSSSGSSSSTEIHYAGARVTNGSERIMGSDPKTHLDILQGSWSMLSWSRNIKEWWSTITTTRKQETLTSHLSPSTTSDEASPKLHLHDNNYGASSWENRELWSRDGHAKLKTNVFFASFDQRSKQASGESACSALAVFIAHWLHSNKDMPTRSQLDRLIIQGSSEWRRLCRIDSYLKLFPDKHFDLETILEANLKPLIVLPQKSYTGFFSPEKFQCLKGAMSFDEVWDEIDRNSNVVDDEPRIYMVGWKDHFFVLKVEVDTYYIIDTLGERLFEGCQKAFILKFDSSSLMHSRVDKVEKDSNSKGSEEESLEIVCSGKECCKEFIKRFLAAIPLRQLEEEENKGNVSNPYLHKLLQIDLHYALHHHCSAASSRSFFS